MRKTGKIVFLSIFIILALLFGIAGKAYADETVGDDGYVDFDEEESTEDQADNNQEETKKIKIKSNGDKTEVNVGEDLQLYVDAESVEGTTSITWTSSDESIATVDPIGIVTAVKEGTVTIKAATTDENNFDEFQVKVNPAKEENKQEENKATNNSDNKEQNKSTNNEAKTEADTNHPQTGSVENAVIIASGIALVSVVTVAYIKMKKYNF